MESGINHSGSATLVQDYLFSYFLLVQKEEWLRRRRGRRRELFRRGRRRRSSPSWRRLWLTGSGISTHGSKSSSAFAIVSNLRFKSILWSVLEAVTYTHFVPITTFKMFCSLFSLKRKKYNCSVEEPASILGGSGSPGSRSRLRLRKSRVREPTPPPAPGQKKAVPTSAPYT